MLTFQRLRLAIVACLALASVITLGAQTSGGMFSVALTGDSLITRPLSPYKEPPYVQLIDLLRAQDAAFTNLEMNLHNYEVYPMVESGGLHLSADPAIAKELVWAGFRLASFANNHTVDWGVEGMRLTEKYAQQAGLVLAGAGESLPEARAPRFLDTPRGRIALVATASTFTTAAPAGASRGDVLPRPGLSPLHFSTTAVVTDAGLTAVRTLARELGVALPPGDRVTLFDTTFVRGEKPGVHTAPNAADLEQIASAASNGRRLSDLTIVSIHAHEGTESAFVPAEFLVTFAHAMIDAGADVFVGHGPHVLRAIEIYKGKPIFYSLGDFVFENATVDRLPMDDYDALAVGASKGIADFNEIRYDNDRKGFPAEREIWESVVAVPRWRNRVLQQVELYPITLGFGQPAAFRGRPMLADDSLGRKIIGDLQRLSEPFHTRIDYRDRVGIITVP